jgi:hypothetical protein
MNCSIHASQRYGEQVAVASWENASDFQMNTIRVFAPADDNYWNFSCAV